MATDQDPAAVSRGIPGSNRHDNPFVAISLTARLVIITYFIFWRILPEVAAAVQFETQAWGIVAGRFSARVALDLLLLLPFFLRRFAGTPVGWVHPLVLPTLLSVAKEIATNPYTLLTAVMAWHSAPVTPEYYLMTGMSLKTMLAAELKRDALLLLAQCGFLLGFAAYSRRVWSSGYDRPAGIYTIRLMMVIGVCFSVFVYLMHANGGLISYFSSLAYGRFLAAEFSGHLIVVISILPYLMVLWYVSRPTTLRQPWFIALLAASLFVQFATTGSRSSLFIPIALILAAWMLLNGRVPAIRAASFAILATVSLGVLADLRGSATSNQGVVDLSVLSDIELIGAVERTIEQRARLTEISGQIATIYAVPESVPHLYGTTYLSTIAFFIPRSLWPDKPRGPGAHVGAIIYSGMNSTADYTGTAFPPGGMAEAYWNFGMFGVVAVYLAFGLFMRLVTQAFLRRPAHPLRIIFFLVAMITLGEPSSDSMVGFLQTSVLLILTWSFVRRPRRQTLALVSDGGPRQPRGLASASSGPLTGSGQ